MRRVADLLFLVAIGHGYASAQADRPVTFAEHVAPIVFNRCTSCHRAGQAAPFRLETYRDVQKRGRMIAEVVRRRYMPPWHPVDGHGSFKDALRLSDAEISTIDGWVTAGMPEGDAKRTPPVPTFPDGWQLGQPDLIVRMPKGYPVPAGGPDIYRSFVIPLDLDDDVWVTAIEVRPSARTVLHHVLFSFDTSGRLRKLDGRDGKPGIPAMDRAIRGSRTTAGIGGWAVGGQARHLPLGLARKIPKGADLVLQSHFHPSGKSETERTELGLFLAKRPPDRRPVGLQLPPQFGFAAGLDIPPGESNFTIRDSFTLPVATLGLTVGGHAHSVCRAMQLFATQPGGKRESIFKIDDWDFDWQNRYHYAAPMPLPKGTKIDAIITYDNSDQNPNNPFDPPKRIRWGLQSTEEMGSITLLLVAAREADRSRLQRAIRSHRRAALRGSGARKGLAAMTLSRLKMMDADGDGRITRDELSSRYRRWFSLFDADDDGSLTETELESGFERLQERFGRRRRDR